MTIVKVTYTTNADYAAQNQLNIKAVMADLQKINNPGINYFACVGADGASFIHTAYFNSDDDRKVLNDLPSFKHFQTQLQAGGLTSPPKQEMLTLVGSSRVMFGS